jgi:ligand-binding sensor domain-containing protein/signal transduction histidine kinase
MARMTIRVIHLRALLLLWACLIAPTVTAQDQPSSQWGLRVWQVEDGLPQNQVRAICQTRDGYLWLATFDGLARFDGVRFVIFNRANTPELHSNIFTSLYEDITGTLWIGSDGGLVRYRDQRFTTFTTAQGLAADMVNHVTGAPDGRLFVATRNQVQTLESDTVNRTPIFSVPANRSIRQLYVSRSGDLWIASNEGAVQIRAGLAHRYGAAEGLSSTNLLTVLEDQSGSLWFGTVGQGVIRWQQGKVENFSLRHGQPDNIVYALTQDARGQIWAGTHGGLYQFKDGRFVRASRASALPSDFVIALCPDREGNLWVGTDGGGLACLHESGVQSLTTHNGLAGNHIYAVIEDRQRKVWAASWLSDGLGVWENGRFRLVGQANPLLKGGVRTILEDRHGTLWLGVTANRLVNYRQGRFTDVTPKDVPLAPIFALAEDAQGTLWVGRQDGLFRWQEGRLIEIANLLKQPIPAVRIILTSRRGGLWIGTDYGLLHYHDGALRSFTEREGLPYPFISGLYEDADGALWIGTRGGGLCRLKDGVLITITTKEGLPTDTIYQMLEDKQGNLWCGSSRGIFRVSRQELNQLAERKITRLHSVFYDHAEGMRSSVHFGTHPSACQTSDGKLWFPTLSGILVIEPEKFRFNAVAPPVVIEQVIVDKQAFPLGAEIVAPPGRGELEVQYTGLSFVAPESVSFRYHLDGFKQDWVEAGTRRTAFYTNLPPGQYTFRVLARNNDGVWNETGATIRLRLQPHFYQTWWFYGCCALVVAGLAWLIHYRRVQQMQARHSLVMTERNRIARDIHDTLAQEVAGLLAQLQVIKMLLPVSPQKAGQHLERAVQLARTGLADARRLVLDLRHQALEHDDLATALEKFIAQVRTEDAPPVVYQVKGTPRRLGEEQENNLLRIGQEAITNALRHARAKEIEVTLGFESKQVELRVQDNGCGFDVTTSTQGFGGHYGLLGIRERAAQIGGELSLSSQPQAGTEVKIRVKTGTAS